MEGPPLRVSKDHKDYGVEPVEGAENLGAEETEGVTVDNVEDYVVPEQYRDQPVIHIPTETEWVTNNHAPSCVLLWKSTTRQHYLC